MTRQIICRACYEKRGPMHPEDVMAGWQQRFVHGPVKKPVEHDIKVYSGPTLDTLKMVEVKHLPSLVCDRCNKPLDDGVNAVAVTMWRPRREPEPDFWEKGYLP